MKNNNFNVDKYLITNTKSIKDYIRIIRLNLPLFTLISVAITLAAISYALTSKDIYKSSVDLKINTEKQSILETTAFPQIGGALNDRFIANEIEIILNYDSRERYASALIDSFNSAPEKSSFSLIASDNNINDHKNINQLAKLLRDVIGVKQLDGLDIIQLSAESPSPLESALIANTCADQYKKLNLENNRGQLTTIRKFLEEQSKEKYTDLNKAEEELKNYQQQGGIVSLDAQSAALINQLANLDAQKDAARVDLLSSNEVLKQYKQEMKEQDPQLADYLESQASQTYIDALQKQIAELQMNNDLAMSNKNSNVDVSSKIQEYDKKIAELKQKLNSVINDIKVGAYASSPEQIRDLTQKLIEEKVKNNALSIRYNEIQNLIAGYDKSFNKLPRKSIEFAQFQRKRTSMQQLYLLIEQKYQEAMINELSQPGNAVIIAKGRMPEYPVKPDRILLMFIGLFAGCIIAFFFVLIKDYFDDTIKSPDDIEQVDAKMLGWVPYLKNAGENYFRNHELGTSGELDAIIKASFKSIRARIHYSKENELKPIKIILVTSPAAQEGKTMISMNLASSFVRNNKKTLLIDCDFIRPRIHSIMGIKRTPGLTDYLQNKEDLDTIINKSRINGFDYIAAGSPISNTDQLMDSVEMKAFLNTMRDIYEIIVVDSAPLIPVTDSQILARSVDTSILVVSSGQTEFELMTTSLDLIKQSNLSFLGVVLNKFKYKNGYHYYYKYYYNYSPNVKSDGKIKILDNDETELTFKK